MDQLFKNKWAPLIVAIIIGAVVLAWYASSGKGSLDASIRNVMQDPNIKNIDATDSGKVIIKCKNGENYQLIIDQTGQNYDDQILNLCGEEGTMESEK